MVYDKYGRPVTNLRVSITQRCNYKCPYCHKEGEYYPSVEMTPSEIESVTNVAAGFGVNKVKITGGEPLLRGDVVEIVDKIAHTPGIEEVSMTTNSSRLAKIATELKKAGLKRVNITLPTANPELYHEITGGNLDEAISGIRAAVKAGLNPVKLNMVVLRDVNYEEVDRMIEFARKEGVTLQLIELEPLNVSPEYYRKHFVSLEDIEEKLKKKASKVDVRRYMQSRRIYHLEGVDVELVRPIENSEFCFHCTRIRLTSDGKLKPCLMRNDNVVDIAKPLKSGADNKVIMNLYLEAVNRREPFYKPIKKQMT
ncbi:MAG TPA: GTP 3',8-cyclase MoaA [archaeon]|nr:GTP 3',8-cyclase MoaA [archaeon]